MPGKTPAPTEAPYALKSDKPADIEAATKPGAERLATILEASNYQPLDWLQKGSKKQLVICNSSGVPQYVTTTGDVTNDESGEFTIAKGAVGVSKLSSEVQNTLDNERTPSDGSVTPAKLAAAAVEEAKIKDAAVTSRKVKITEGITRNSGGENWLTGEWKNIVGPLSITPTVSSIVHVTATAAVGQRTGNSSADQVFIDLAIGGVRQGVEIMIAWEEVAALPGIQRQNPSLLGRFEISAAKHELSVMAKCANNAAAAFAGGQLLCAVFASPTL